MSHAPVQLGLIVQQLAIHFEGRLQLEISLQNDTIAGEKKK
jgi:hypothetical protein